MIRQNVFLIARGTVFVGFFASAAVIPTISVPMNEKPAERRTFNVPRPPPANAPGVFQYSKPITWSPRPPEVTQIANQIRVSKKIFGRKRERNLTNDDKDEDNKDFQDGKPVFKFTIKSDTN